MAENNNPPELPEDDGSEYFWKMTDPKHPHRTRWLYFLFLFLYFGATIIAPFGIISAQYHIFDGKKGPTGIVLFILACLLWALLKVFKKKVLLIGEGKKSLRLIKYICLAILDGGAWAIFASLCWIERTNWSTFLNVCAWCAVCEGIGVIVNLFCKEFEYYFASLNKAVEYDSMLFLSRNRKKNHK